MKKIGLTAVVGLLLVAAFFSGSGCSKEYSYEQRPVDTTAGNTVPAEVRLNCSACTADLPDSSWQVTIDGVLYCGAAEKAILTFEKTAFTFFGPSSCSRDSGFVASVYIENDLLNADKKNVRARLACYYYDRIEPSSVYMSAGTQPLHLTITSFEHSTGRTKGTFYGYALDKNGIMREVKNGRFDVNL